MKFRFCGDLDCPDWILAEINTLSRMSSVKMKLLCQHVAKSLLGEEMNYEKVKKLTSDAKFDIGDIKASVAALSFIFTSSARHAVEEDVLSGELQQLGLPKEHTSCLVKVHSDNLQAMVEKLKSESLRLNRVEDIQWRIGFVSQSSHQGIPPDTTLPEAVIKLKVWDVVTGTHQTHEFTTSLPKLSLLVHELKTASNLMHSKLSPD